VKLEERRRLHGLTKDELQKELTEAERALLDLRFDAGLNRLSNPAALHNTRKRIALLKTLIRQRDLLAEHGFATMDEYKAYKAAENRTFRLRRKASR
jgi:ribosomal protein L29